MGASGWRRSLVEPSDQIRKILENKSQTLGYDARTGQFVDMVSAGIVDPAKVVRVALQDASIAYLMVTTEGRVPRLLKKNAAPAVPGGGGMGGMDYRVAQIVRRQGRGDGSYS